MKITIYELIGLVKEGKQPKKIKYKGQEYTFFRGDGIIDYSFKDDNNINDWLSTHISNEYISDMFTNTVEIIEESKNIKKIEIYKDEEGHYFLNKQDRKVYVNCDEMDFMVDKFNELIDEINNLKEK